MNSLVANTRNSGYWMATVVAALLFAVPGGGLLHFTEDMAHLGYPSYFLVILGAWKILGALAILAPGLPRLKEWAYAGMIFDTTGAAISRAVVGDNAAKIVAPLVVASIVILSWSLRSAGHVLKTA
jgi:hypothetical protein